MRLMQTAKATVPMLAKDALQIEDNYSQFGYCKNSDCIPGINIEK
jgi:hypothetical protein